MEENSTPKLPKIPFIAVDIVLVIAAIFIANSGDGPLNAFNFFWVIFCITLGGVLACLPFYVEFRNHMRLAEYDKSQANHENSRRIEAAQADIQQTCEAITQQADRGERAASVIEHMSQRLDSKIEEIEGKIGTTTTNAPVPETSPIDFDEKFGKLSQEILAKLENNQKTDLDEVKGLLEAHKTETQLILTEVLALIEKQESAASKESMEVVSDEFEALPVSAHTEEVVIAEEDEITEFENDDLLDEAEDNTVNSDEESEVLSDDFTEDVEEDEPDQSDEIESISEEESLVNDVDEDIEEQIEAAPELEEASDDEPVESTTEVELDDTEDEEEPISENEAPISNEEPIATDEDESAEEEFEVPVAEESVDVEADEMADEIVSEQDSEAEVSIDEDESIAEATEIEEETEASTLEEPSESETDQPAAKIEADDDFDAFSEDISMSVEADLIPEESDSLEPEDAIKADEDPVVADDDWIDDPLESVSGQDVEVEIEDDNDLDPPSTTEPIEDDAPVAFLPDDVEDTPQTEENETVVEDQEHEAIAETVIEAEAEAAVDQPDLMEDIPEGSEKAKKSGRKETALVAQVLIGIGNKPYLRGEGAGLSEDVGVPMDFLEIGKWQWIAPDSTEPILCQIFKNDEVEAEGEPIIIEPGQKRIITPKFPT